MRYSTIRSVSLVSIDDGDDDTLAFETSRTTSFARAWGKEEKKGEKVEEGGKEEEEEEAIPSATLPIDTEQVIIIHTQS